MTRKENWSIETPQAKNFNPLLEKGLIINKGKNTLLSLIKTREPKVKATRHIIDNLITTVNSIKATALEKYEKNGNDFTEDYLTVVEAAERIHLVFENIKSIPLGRNKELEDQKNDGSHRYSSSGKIILQGAREKKTFEHIRLLIRPEPTSKRQARSAMQIYYNEGTIPRIAGIRIDQNETGMNVFDLSISNPDKSISDDNIVNILDLEEAGQEAGHHFKCNFVPQGVTPSDIHKTIDQGLDLIAKKTLLRNKTRHDKYIGFKDKKTT